MSARVEPQRLLLKDRAAWRQWLDSNESSSDGVRLVLAKKGTSDSTSLSYSEALEEAICSGWIDGRRNALNELTFLQHFLPRRTGSNWSQRNVSIVSKLQAEGRMRQRGEDEIAAAKFDGRWDRAYPGQATAEAPEELLAALRQSPRALANFEALSKGERYPLILEALTSPDNLRSARIARMVLRLEAR